LGLYFWQKPLGKNLLNTMICFKEKELIAGSLDNFNLYYQMS
jgi:hypothetical protein